MEFILGGGREMRKIGAIHGISHNLLLGGLQVSFLKSFHCFESSVGEKMR